MSKNKVAGGPMTAERSIESLVPNGCGKCLVHFYERPFLVEAFASVGIEHGKSTAQMALEYFAVFHKNKHKDPPPTRR